MTTGELGAEEMDRDAAEVHGGRCHPDLWWTTLRRRMHRVVDEGASGAPLKCGIVFLLSMMTA